MFFRTRRNAVDLRAGYAVALVATTVAPIERVGLSEGDRAG
jgi:hypothetical protein